MLARLLLCVVLALPSPAQTLHRQEGADFNRRAEAAEALAREARTGEAAAAFADLAGRAKTHEGTRYALLRRAEVLRRGGEAEAAYAAWQEVARRLPGTPAAVRATYHAAVTAYDALGRKEEALSTFSALVREHPDAIQAPRALHRLALERAPGKARVAFYRGLYPKVRASDLGPLVLWRCGLEAEAHGLELAALGCYLRLLAEHPTRRLADGAALHAARLQNALGNPEAALTLYRGLILREGPPAAQRDEALYEYGLTQAGPGADPRAARSALRTLLREHPTSLLADDALAQLARLAAAREDHARARRLWRRLLDQHPDSRHAEEARAALR